MATAAQVEQFRQGYDEVERLVRRDLRRIWTGLRGATPETIRDVLLDLTPRLTDQYGAVAATMAAEWFEVVTGRPAQMADVTVAQAVQRSVRDGAGGLWRDQREEAFGIISSRLVRHSLQPGRLTVAGSASRHGMKYARAPEVGACAWCLMLASRGAVYGSAYEARHVFRAAGAGGQPAGSRYHDDCRCVPEPVRDDSELSYDVGALYDRYSAAWSDGANDSEVAARMRELYGLS